MLLGGVVDQDVELAERGEGFVDDLAADLAIGHVTGEGQAATPVLFDHSAGFLSVLMLVEVENCHVGALTGVEHGHRAADAAVTTGDDRHLAFELARRLVVFAAVFRARVHQPFLAGLGLLLRR